MSIANPPASGLYYSTKILGTAVASASINWSPNLVNGAQSGGVEVMLYLPEFIGSGTFYDTVTAYVCTDSKCANQIAGSPVSISVTYTVTGNAISDASYAVLPAAIALEIPSNAAPPSTTVNVTAYNVPPYGAYVFYTSKSGGPVASMSFKQTSANAEPYAYGTGVLTVNLKTPAALGPGIYSDLITLSLCYDTACTRPAAGSPWSIPLTYTVTASAGREFQQKIIALNLTALAVDPTGTTLYGTTEETNTVTAKLLQINPVSGTVTASLDVNGDFSQIVVSSDGQYVYLASGEYSQPGNNPPNVTRVNTAAMTADFSVYPTQQEAPLTVAVSPQNSRTWSLAFMNQSSPAAPLGYAVKVFDDSTPRVDAFTNDLLSGTIAQWSGDASTLYILGSNLYSAPVTASGLGTGTVLLAPNPSTKSGFNTTPMQLVGGLLYSDGGGVLDPTTDTLLGQYTFETPSGFSPVNSAFLAVDTVNNRAFAAYGEPQASGVVQTLQSFNRTQFSSIWITRLPVGSPPIRWGINGLAFIGPDPTGSAPSALYLINGPFVAP